MSEPSPNEAVPNPARVRAAERRAAELREREQTLGQRLIDLLARPPADEAEVVELATAWEDASHMRWTAEYQVLRARYPNAYPCMNPGWTIVQWVVLAALSGVIGNVTYDAVLRAAKSVKALGNTGRKRVDAPRDAESAVLIAELATAVRLRDLGWANPGKHSHHQAECDHFGQWTVQLSYEKDDLEAVVVLPPMVTQPELISVLVRKKE